VCKRHCKTLLRKHVFPLLYMPAPTADLGSHEESRMPLYKQWGFDGEGVFGEVNTGEGGSGRVCRKH
jgi:hypothetical protein